MSPHEKSARGEIITDLICLSLIKPSAIPLKKPYYKIATQKSLHGRQFTGKNSSRPGSRRAGRIFTGKLSAGENFSGEGLSYNGTPAGRN